MVRNAFHCISSLILPLGTMSLNNGKSRDFNLRTRYDEKTEHSQICVTGILNLLKKVVPDDARCLVALTMHDLYGDDTDLFIAGLSMGNCRVAAFSLYRYDPHLTFNESDWFDCKLKIVNNSEIQIVERRDLLLIRACRLLTHEICHLFGIAHCIFYSCLVNGSGDLGKNYFQWTNEDKSSFCAKNIEKTSEMSPKVIKRRSVVFRIVSMENELLS